VLTAAREVRAYPEIRPDLVGGWGFSQGGWVIPVAAAEGGGDLAFTIIGSGPTVTLGEELLYSALTGEDVCRPSGRSPSELERRWTGPGPPASIRGRGSNG